MKKNNEKNKVNALDREKSSAQNKLLRRTRFSIGLATALLLVGAGDLPAQTWQTILQIDSAVARAENYRGDNRAIMIDPLSSAADFPSLIAAGKPAGENSSLHGLDQAADPGATGRLPLDACSGSVFSLTSDDTGTLYWAGDMATGTSTTAWEVRRSIDGGVTWTTIRTFSLGGARAQARGVSVDSAGNLVVCGLALDAAGYSHWIVETKTPTGDWVTRDVFKSSAQTSLTTGESIVQALGVAELPGPDGGLFVVGSRGNRFSGRWTVTRSRDGGQSWQTVDSWLPSSKGSSRARKVSVDNTGRIFVLGDSGGGHEIDASPWVVRMSADAGTNWVTVFGPWQVGIEPVPLDMTVSVNGDVWLAGRILQRYFVGPSKNNYAYFTTAMVVRLQETGTVPWSFQSYAVSPECADAKSASAASITADVWGRVYVNGTYRQASTSPTQWFVHRWMP